jgi:hypothetical protein
LYQLNGRIMVHPLQIHNHCLDRRPIIPTLQKNPENSTNINTYAKLHTFTLFQICQKWVVVVVVVKYLPC